MARRPVLDEIKRGAICAILSMGGSRRRAALYVGCAAETIRRTAQRDRDFRDQLSRAESLCEVKQLKNLDSASKKHWRAAAWMLERMYPDQYGPRRPNIVTREQIGQLLSEFAVIVVHEVPDEASRRRILRRFASLTQRGRIGPTTEPTKT